MLIWACVSSAACCHLDLLKELVGVVCVLRHPQKSKCKLVLAAWWRDVDVPSIHRGDDVVAIVEGSHLVVDWEKPGRVDGCACCSAHYVIVSGVIDVALVSRLGELLLLGLLCLLESLVQLCGYL